MKWLGWLVAAVAVALLIVQWRVTDRATERWRDRVGAYEDSLAVRATLDTVRQAEIAALTQLADSLKHARPAPPAPRPSLPPPHPPAGTTADSLRYWRDDALAARARADSLDQDLRVARTVIDAQTRELEARARLTALLQQQDSLHVAQRDTARALLATAPARHRRGITVPVLGLRLCPVVGPGYGLSLADGTVRAGLVAAVIQPLSCR